MINETFLGVYKNNPLNTAYQYVGDTQNLYGMAYQHTEA